MDRHHQYRPYLGTRCQYLDYERMERVARLVHDLGWRVGNLDHRPVVDKPKPDPQGSCRQ